jgi:LysM repeat protein
MNRGFRRSIHLLTALVLVTVSLASLAVVAPVGAQGSLCTPYHVVQPGENLYRIARAYGTTWPVLARLNGIYNPNRILIGQVICLPAGSVPGFPPPYIPPGGVVTPPSGGTYFPPSGVYPSIDFNPRVAGPGDTITITGRNFPGSRAVDIFITRRGTPYPAIPSGTATTNADGTLNAAFVIPTAVAGAPLQGQYFSVLVREPQSGYYGFSWFTNPRP